MMSLNSVLVRILESVLGVPFGGSVTDSVVVIATTLLVTIFGVLVLMWGSQEVLMWGSQEALMVKDEEDEFETERRRWEELDINCLVNVFGRVGMESLLLDVPFVCKSWHRIALDPLCWLSIDFPKTHHTLIGRFRAEYQIEMSRFSVTGLMKLVINRSMGNVTVLKLPGWCTKQALEFVADSCLCLKSLYVADELLWSDWMQSRIFPNLICKWKNLEELSLEGTYNFENIVEQISVHCKKLTALHVFNTMISREMILSIVDFLPNIKYLTMKNFSFLPRDALVILLRGCKDLVFLDVRKSRGFKESDEEILKLASHISTFMCDGSTDVLDEWFPAPLTCNTQLYQDYNEGDHVGENLNHVHTFLIEVIYGWVAYLTGAD